MIAFRMPAAARLVVATFVFAIAVLEIPMQVCGPSALFGQENTSRPEDVRAAVTRHLDMRYTPPVFRTREEWLARREELRNQILVSAGLYPAPRKCDLNPVIFDKLDRKGYSIEKVYFESYPGFFVTGNLYRPLGRKGPFPGVLAPHGHWTYGRLQNSELCSVPARCITLALQGYVVFSYDMVGYNDSRQVTHRFQGEREALWGFSSLGLQLWNSIRCLDFLESLPEVDRKRLSCTGESGGGTQTFLLTAVDDRVAVSAPVNMISAHMQGGDVCENAPNLRIDTNNVEIAALAAPRPMLMVSATGDWTKDTLEVEYPAVQRIYRLLGAEDKVSAVRENAEHNYNKQSREHVYRWFAKWLLGATNLDAFAEPNEEIEQVTDLLVFYGRNLPSTAKGQKDIVEEYVRNADTAVNAAKPADPAGLERYRRAFLPALQYSLMAEWPAPGTVQAFASQPVKSATYQVVKFYLQRQGKGDRVPATLWMPAPKTQVKRAVLLVHPEGARVFELEGNPGAFVAGLLKQGCSVLIPDVFNTGRAAFSRTEKKDFFTTYNRTDDANRVQDVLTSLAYLRDQAGKLPVNVVGYEKAGLWCLFSRALAADDAAFSIDLDGFEGGDDSAYLKTFNVPGIRRAGDARTAGILNLRGELWIQNPGKSFPSEWLESVYTSLGKRGLLLVDPQRVDQAVITDWILQGRQAGK